MIKTTHDDRLPELREFIKENDQRLYDFCVYMLYGGMDVDELILSIFREFGDHYRRLTARKDSAREPHEIRTKLFQTAWERIREAIAHTQFTWTVGRDTRQLKGFDDDILRSASFKGKQLAELEGPLMERLGRIDPDFRVPVVLRDILKFEDEEVVRILGVRWGVYRHRLHRGRLELKDGLRGKALTSEAKGITVLHPSHV